MPPDTSLAQTPVQSTLPIELNGLTITLSVVVLIVVIIGFVWWWTQGRYLRVAWAAMFALSGSSLIPRALVMLNFAQDSSAVFWIDSAPAWIAIPSAVVAIVALVCDLKWKLCFSHDKSQIASRSTAIGNRHALAQGKHGRATTGRHSPIFEGDQISGSRIMHVHADPALVDKLLDKERQLVHAQQTIYTLKDQNRCLRESVSAGLARITLLAIEGDRDAKEAIQDARITGDATKLKNALVSQASTSEQSIAAATSEYLEFHREIAAVSILACDVEQARRSLRILLEHLPDDLEALSQLGDVLVMNGELDIAEAQWRRILESRSTDSRHRAAAYNHLGIILRVRGDLAGAETMHRSALKIDTEMNRHDRVARDCAHIATVLQFRGELSQAECMWNKAIDQFREMGDEHSLASSYGNLAQILFARGDICSAEAHLKQALDIYRSIQDPVGMANAYGSLGLVLREQGQLQSAEAMHCKALELYERLGQQEGIATELGHLGMVRRAQGDQTGSEEFHRKALAIDERIGRTQGIATHYGNLGLVAMSQRDFHTALERCRKSLAMHERVGDKEGIAAQCANLGLIMRDLNRFQEARTYLMKSLDLFTQCGIEHQIKRVRAWIDSLPFESEKDSV